MIKTNRRVLEVLKVHTTLRRIGFLFRTPIFWLLSIGGNLFMLLGAYVLRWLEGEVNPATQSLLDCFNWAVGIVTTVGASPIAPVTTNGKVLMIFMMIGGTVFLWSYMALFIG
ncbi:MAG: ion channel, partial [Bdellovibrionales bacterium]